MVHLVVIVIFHYGALTHDNPFIRFKDFNGLCLADQVSTLHIRCECQESYRRPVHPENYHCLRP